MSVLAVVAHPDDEVLGAGGTLARHANGGEDVSIVFLADGVTARGSDETDAHRRAEAARQAASALGAQSPRFLGYPDQRLDSVDLLDLVRAVERVVSEVQPDTVYTHHCGDLNIDHVICHRVVLTACRPLPDHSVRRIYAMEVASSTEWNARREADVFHPNRFVDISATMVAKRRALEAYAGELRAFPHPRSFEAIEALARWRGASVGRAAAEAFVVLREVEV